MAPYALNQSDGVPHFLRFLAEPDNCLVGGRVNLAHKSDLIFSFVDVILVNAWTLLNKIRF